MSKSQILSAPLRALVTLLLLAGLCAAPRALAQANANPPERMTYQGYLVDGNGTALATNAPKNYDVVFRIWDAATGNNRLWAEQQTVTVDKGNFSVLLGEGSALTTPVEPHPALSTLFTNGTASDRYVEMTVKGIGAGNADVTILPRLRLLTSPYAFLARSAKGLVSSSGGGELIAENLARLNSYNNFTAANNFAGSVGFAGFANFASEADFNGETYFFDTARFTGNVGIGSGNPPVNKLSVTGNANFTGNVGIGTTNPATKLQVVGDVKLGSAGQYYAAAGVENLRIIRGTVKPDGTIYNGTGFSVSHDGTGIYSIVFSSGFTDVPALVITPFQTGSPVTVGLGSGNTTGYSGITIWSNSTKTDEWWSFIAIGAR